MRALLISTYEMGHQPFGLASPAAWLRAAGWAVTCVDVAKDRLRDEFVSGAALIGFHLPMHTATRLAAPVISKARRFNPSARICAYGLYAPLNAEWLRSLGVDDVLGGEFEEELTAIAHDVSAGCSASLPPSHEASADGRSLGGGGQACATAGLAPAARVVRPAHHSLGLSRGAKTASLQALQREQATALSRERWGWGSSAVKKVGPPEHTKRTSATPEALPRLHFLVPDRSGLPSLDRYATLQMGDGRRKLVGHTEASRGCRHLCRHCPVVPIYNGQFRVVQPDIVLADIAGQVRAGAEHITFGDPDFFNGPTHAMRIVEALHRAHPALTYDVTIKIEHLLRYRNLLPGLRETGCVFVTSAAESVDDLVLARLEKGHTRRDFIDAVALCCEAGVTIVPTFVAFHPWLALDGYCDLLDTLEALDLVDHVAPIQLAIRLLIPERSRLLELEEIRGLVGAFDPATLTYRWTHPDHRVENLHRDVAALVGLRLTADRRAIFGEISALARERAGLPRVSACGPRKENVKPARDRATVPYLNEPWYC